MKATRGESDLTVWMRAAQRGDGVAYASLLEGLTIFLRGVLRKRLLALGGSASADVEDIVQEALLAIHLNLSRWAPDRALEPWAASIASNKLISFYRSQRNLSFRAIDEMIEDLSVEPVDFDITPEQVERLLSSLRGKQRGVVRAVAVEGDDIRDAAANLGMTEGHVRNALHHGLATLRAQIAVSETA